MLVETEGQLPKNRNLLEILWHNTLEHVGEAPDDSAIYSRQDRVEVRDRCRTAEAPCICTTEVVEPRARGILGEILGLLLVVETDYPLNHAARVERPAEFLGEILLPVGIDKRRRRRFRSEKGLRETVSILQIERIAVKIGCR